MPGVIIPRKTIEILQKITKGKACPQVVKIDVSETKIKLTFDNVEFLSKLIDGTFPDYQRCIPSGNDKTVKISAESLLAGVAGVSLMLAERGRAITYIFDGNSLTLKVSNQDLGEAEMKIPCDFKGEPMYVGFNTSYAVGLIATAVPNGGELTIRLNNEGSPAIFTGSRAGWLGLLMPVRI